MAGIGRVARWGLRSFVRGLAKDFIENMAQRYARRQIGRKAAEHAVERFGGRSLLRTTSRTVEEVEDDFLDDAIAQIDILEALELWSDMDQILDQAKKAAVAGSQQVFYSQMGAYNPGQRALVENYCLDYVEEYWETTDAPDPNEFLSGIYSLHEAMEQALSESCEQSYEAGRTAGISSIYSSLSTYIATEVLSRGLDMAGVRKLDDKGWGDLAADVEAQADDIRYAMRRGTLSSNIRWRMNNGHLEHMVVSKSFTGPGSRQLSWNQFFAPRNEQPFWHQENTRLTYLRIRGKITESQMQAERSRLWRATYHNPWSTSPPAGWTYRYNIPIWD